jgi:hypothetical protein
MAVKSQSQVSAKLGFGLQAQFNFLRRSQQGHHIGYAAEFEGRQLAHEPVTSARARHNAQPPLRARNNLVYFGLHGRCFLRFHCGLEGGIQRGDIGRGVFPGLIQLFLLHGILDEFAIKLHHVAALRIGLR